MKITKHADKRNKQKGDCEKQNINFKYESKRHFVHTVHFVLNGLNHMSHDYCMNCLLFLCSYCIQNYMSDITASLVRSDKCFWLQWFIVYRIFCVLGEQSRQKFWQRRLCNSGDRPEGINHECQPLTLSVWSLGHAWAWWSLPGNELQEAASIIHTYKSTVCPLFLEMRLNEGWPYLGSVLLICHWVAFLC